MLARSYWVVAAHRGLVTCGPYALVRHPLYASYMIGRIGCLVQSPSTWNILVDALAVGLQVVRITIEERHLDTPRDTRYRIDQLI